MPEPGRFRSLVTLYKASADYQRLAPSTKRAWAPWLDRIAGYFGDLSIAQFDRPEKIRPVIRQWRNHWAEKLGRISTKRAIVIMTGKSKHRREARIPLYDDLKSVLGNIPKYATTILTNSRRRPWTRAGFGSSFNKAKIAAGMADANLHFHDLRGTAATRFYVAGLPGRVIAEIMGWEEEHVERILRRYVDRGAATRAIIRQLNEKRT